MKRDNFIPNFTQSHTQINRQTNKQTYYQLIKRKNNMHTIYCDRIKMYLKSSQLRDHEKIVKLWTGHNTDLNNKKPNKEITLK